MVPLVSRLDDQDDDEVLWLCMHWLHEPASSNCGLVVELTDPSECARNHTSLQRQCMKGMVTACCFLIKPWYDAATETTAPVPYAHLRGGGTGTTHSAVIHIHSGQAQ
jgi:hypothetical protein